MDEDFPLSKLTIERAIKLSKCAVKLGLGEPLGAMDYKAGGDLLIYIFTNQSSMAIVYATPTCYLVAYGDRENLTDETAEYLIISNVRTFLQKLKKEKYQALTKKQMEELAKTSEKEPSDEELNKIEDEEDRESNFEEENND